MSMRTSPRHHAPGGRAPCRSEAGPASGGGGLDLHRQPVVADGRMQARGRIQLLQQGCRRPGTAPSRRALVQVIDGKLHL
jgi:hypothetical protein